MWHWGQARFQSARVAVRMTYIDSGINIDRDENGRTSRHLHYTFKEDCSPQINRSGHLA